MTSHDAKYPEAAPIGRGFTRSIAGLAAGPRTSDAHGRRQARAPRPESHRPALLLAAPRDHVEAGSSLRSAAAPGIVLAEAARQLGTRAVRAPRPPRRGLSYGSVLSQTVLPDTDLVHPWELTQY